MNDADVALDFVPGTNTFAAATDANVNVVTNDADVADAAVAGAVVADVSVEGHDEVHTKGRMAEPEAQIFSDTVRRLSRSRGGVFEMLSLLPGQVAGEPAQSLEGWVLIVTGLTADCKEVDLLDYFGQHAPLKNCRMNFDRRTSKCVGHAFVEYQTKEDAMRVSAAMDGQPFLESNRIGVSPAFLVPELSAFDQLGRVKRGRRATDRIGADDVEGDDAAEGNDERGGARAE